MEDRVRDRDSLHAELIRQQEQSQRFADHIEDLTRQVHELHKQLGEVSATAEERIAVAEEAAGLTEGLAETVRTLEVDLEDSRRHNLEIMSSKSFRLTAPLRWIRSAYEARRTK